MINKNSQTIEEYLENKKTLNDEIEDSTIYIYKKALENISKKIKKPFININRKDIIEILKGKRQRTKNFNIVLIKDIYRYINEMDKEDKLPKEIFRDIKPKKIKINHITYREKIVTEEEKQKLLDYANSPMHKAIIEVLSETGCRESELTTMNSKDIKYKDGITYYKIRQSKSEPRIVRVTGRNEIVMLWVEELQPYKDSDAREKKPMFASKSKEKPTRIHKNYPNTILTRLCKNIKKDISYFRKITPHDFRHTKATNMGKNKEGDFATTQLGIKRKALEIYMHTNGDDYEAYLRQRMEKIPPTYKALRDKYIKEKEENKKNIQTLGEALNRVMEKLGIEGMAKLMGTKIEPSTNQNKTYKVGRYTDMISTK